MASCGASHRRPSSRQRWSARSAKHALSHAKTGSSGREKGYVDMLLPMLYNPDAAWVGRAVARAVEQTDGRVLVAAGIGVYLGYSPGLVVEQILEAEASGSLGVTHFALGQMRGAHFAALKQGLYSRPAVPPYKTVEALHALGARSTSRSEMTDGPHELRAVADALTGYTGRDEAELAG